MAMSPQMQFNQGQSYSPFSMGGAGAMFQPGFAGTNPQRVRQDIMQDMYYGSNQGSGGSQMMMQPQWGGSSTYTTAQGAQAMFQPGFAGTNPQRVRQDIIQDMYSGSNQGWGGSQMMMQPQWSTYQPTHGAQMMFQPGFAGTNPQGVRQDIMQDMYYGSNQGSGGSQMMMQPQWSGASFYAPTQGAQTMFQPGFAGTNPQGVRQDIMQDMYYGSNQNIFGGNQMWQNTVQ